MPAHALQATPHHRKVAGNAFCVARSPERPLAPKSYCATVGFFACALLTPYKPSLATKKKPGSAFCAAKPVKKPTAAKSYYGAVGISLAGLACHILCPYSQAPPSYSRGPIASWMRRQPRLVNICTGSNPPSRRCFFCLGFCRFLKGPSFQGIQQSTLKALISILIAKFVFPGQSLSNLLSPCSRLKFLI